MNRNNNNYKKIMFILAQNNFCDVEYHQSRSVFESCGIKCKVASSERNTAIGMEGSFVEPDFQIDKIIIIDYDALCLIGGVGCNVYCSTFVYPVDGVAVFFSPIQSAYVLPVL